MLRFQHKRACIGKAGQTGIVRCSLSRKHARSPSGRPRFCLGAALSLLPRASQRRQKALRAVLVETVAHRAALPYTIGIPFAYDPGPGLLSMEAIADPPAYKPGSCRLPYDDVASTLVHGLKYSDRLDLSPMMGRWMARAGRELLADADALVPVPLHWQRRWAQRYNQSAVLPARHRRFAASPSRMAGSGVSVPHPSRSGGLEPSAPITSKVDFLSRLDTGSMLPVDAWCQSTTC